MGSLALINLSLHVLAAFVWIGSSVFLTLLWFIPVRGTIDQISWEQLHLALGKRYLRWSWLAIEILLLTGIFNLLRVGIDSGFSFQPAFVRRLTGKLLIVLLMIGLQAGLGLVWFPRLAQVRFAGAAEQAVRRALVAITAGGGAALWLAMVLHT